MIPVTRLRPSSTTYVRYQTHSQELVSIGQIPFSGVGRLAYRSRKMPSCVHRAKEPQPSCSRSLPSRFLINLVIQGRIRRYRSSLRSHFYLD